MKPIPEKVDSGALQHKLKNDDKGVLMDMKPATNQVVNLSNNKVITSSFKCQIPDSSVPSKNHKMRIISHISTAHVSSL